MTYEKSTVRTYATLMLAAVIAALALSAGTPGRAQTADVTCSVNDSTVATGETAIFTASGGDGTYEWSGPNLNVSEDGGSEFRVSYPNAGTYPITVESDGETASCILTVTGGTSPVIPPTTPSFPSTGGGFGR